MIVFFQKTPISYLLIKSFFLLSQALNFTFMKYTRNQINKAGEKLLSAKSDTDYNSALAIINDWRTNHLYPLEKLKIIITDLLETNDINPILISQRLKRMSSIQYKLDLNPDMRLGGVQDIGGIRVVLDGMDSVSDVVNILSTNIGDFEYQRTKDYIEHPKQSGYRSIHIIYKYKSKDEKYDGLRFELQIRTKLQHSWATALETVDIHTKSALKSGQGDNDWLIFFKIVSSLFAHKEHEPTLDDHATLNLRELMRMYYKQNSSKNNVSFLRAFRVTNMFLDKRKEIPDYYLLNIDLEHKNIKISPFYKGDIESATMQYYKLESTIDPNKGAVVLVATSSYKLLREAYPSYFSDISNFIESLEKVEENCERLGLT